eukprot:296914-Heterocapsa_arctica.AAC.1
MSQELSGSTLCCASDGDSESDRFCCVCCVLVFLRFRLTILHENDVASPTALANALADGL